MRARNLKPGFFKNEILCTVEPLGRILFAGLWGLADREGRLEDRPQRIKIEILPYDECNVDLLLNILDEKEFIKRYEMDGAKYIQVLNFLKHQTPHWQEKESLIPILKSSKRKPRVIQDKSKSNRADILIPSSLNPDSLNSSSNGTFEVFWKAYPKKKSRPDAERAFQKLNPDESLLKKMLSAIERAKKSKDWLKDSGQFIPFPATWLNGRRWEDEQIIEQKIEGDYPSCEKVMRDQGFSKEDLDRP